MLLVINLSQKYKAARPIHHNILPPKDALLRIVSPYLINVRKLSYEDALSIVRHWLDKCDKIKHLDFTMNSRIKSSLIAAARVGYLPIGFDQLKTDNRQRADLISYQMK